MLVNIWSWSDTIEHGMLWCFVAKLEKAYVTDLLVKGWESGVKCAPFDNLSTTTRIIVLPLKGCNWVKKSIDRSSHKAIGMGRG